MATHRNFLRSRSSLLNLGLLILGVLLIWGCGTDESPTVTQATPGATATPRSDQQMTPTRSSGQPVVSRLKVAMVPPAQNVTIAPQGFYSHGPLRPMYEYLIGKDRFSEAEIPELATEWSMSPDGKDWRFKLQQNVNFHNGNPFVAQDVVRTWEIHSSEKSNSTGAAFWRTWMKSKDDIEIVNDHEVVFHLTTPEALIGLWVSESIAFQIVNDKYWSEVGEEGYTEAPIGTGPFKFMEMVVGSHTLYQRVDNHWRKTPEMQELQFSYVVEDATRLAQLLTGEAHIIDVPRSLVPEARQKGFNIASSTQPGFWNLAVFGGQYYMTPEGLPDILDPSDPLTKLEVRQALNLAIDRAQLNNTFYEGQAQPQAPFGIHPTDRGYSQRWSIYPYDPSKAKTLLAEAGYPNGFQMTLVTMASAGCGELPEVGEAIASYWKAIGVQVNIEQMDVTLMFTRARERNMARAAWMLCNGKVHHELQLPLNLRVHAQVAHYFDHPTVHDLVSKLAASVDNAERTQLVTQVGDYLYDNYASVPLFWIFPVLAVDPSVVEEYSASMINTGPTRSHEYTKLVKK
jgi:peptide/nickel transport system substrate-binding protein